MHDDKLNQEIDELNFAVEKSMRYHQRRRGYYDHFHRMVMFLVVVLGSAAFADIIEEASSYLAAAAAALAAIDLVWVFSHKARDHEILFRRFGDLAIKIRSEKATPESYACWEKQRLSIENDENPIFKALEADCDNEVRHAWGRSQKLVHIDPWSRLTMNWIRHAERTYA